MLKKTITFKDLDDNDVTEDFYFNLSKAELTELELTYPGGFTAHLERVIESEDGAQIISTFKDVILRTVGKRSEDGRRFIKSDEIRDDFVQTDAYSEMFMELCTSAEAAATFIKGIVPNDLLEEINKQMPAAMADRQIQNVVDKLPTGEQPIVKKEPKDMTIEELRAAFAEREKSQS